MPAKHLMIAIDWFGPYADLDEAREAARWDYADGLYLCIGSKGRRRDAVQYVGLGKQLHARLTKGHHKLKHIRISQIWLGEVVTAEPSGKKLKVTKATLDYAEWLHAYFMKLPCNEQKCKKPPRRSVTVLNRWWHTDYDTPRRNRPHPDWPNLIDHPLYGQHSRMVWFGGRQQVFKPDAKRT